MPKAIYAWDAIHFDKGLARAEKIYLDELVSTADAREGIIAFLDKRSPKWTGKSKTQCPNRTPTADHQQK
jgi:hypothetical protein